MNGLQLPKRTVYAIFKNGKKEEIASQDTLDKARSSMMTGTGIRTCSLSFSVTRTKRTSSITAGLTLQESDV